MMIRRPAFGSVTSAPVCILCYHYCLKFTIRNLAIKADYKQIQACFQELNLPLDSKQDAVRRAFLDLAKKYHPDSGSPEADIEKFVSIENAFRILTKHNTGASSTEEVEKIVYDIRHTAPQHRQYLSYEGVGHGTPFQRQKQWAQARAQRAAENVMEHRMSKAVATENTLMKKGQGYAKKHDIKTKYGFDRLVEDLIQESMSKGEFENLSGKGKPLQDQNRNPYVDFTTHKLNEVLINNGFTPEWIMLNKEIEQDIELLKQELRQERMFLGPFPLNDTDDSKWARINSSYKDLSKSINTKINKFNLIVPLMSKQRFHIEFDKIANDVLQNGIHSVIQDGGAKSAGQKNITKEVPTTVPIENADFMGVIFKALGDLFSVRKDKEKEKC